MPYPFAANPVSRSQVGELHIRTAQVANHVLIFLPGASILHQNVIARLVVAAVVANNRNDRNVVSGHGPERIRLSKEKSAVSLKRDNLLVGPRQLDAD